MSKEEILIILSIITLIISVIMLIINYILIKDNWEIQDVFLEDVKKILHHLN